MSLSSAFAKGTAKARARHALASIRGRVFKEERGGSKNMSSTWAKFLMLALWRRAVKVYEEAIFVASFWCNNQLRP